MNYSDKQLLKDKKVAFLTLGCKVNSYETDAIRKQFLDAGSVEVEEAENADIYVVNTCSVTNIADRKSRQMLHRVRQQNPELIIVATGCYAQIGAEAVIESGDADIVVGNSHKAEVADTVNTYLEDRRSCMTLTDMSNEHNYETMQITDCEDRTRAFIKVQDGCNQFCSYCIIPFARGRIRSRSIDSVVSEVTGLVSRGFKEVVLTGIHISSYGLDNYEKQLETFKSEALLSLIKAVAEIEGLERIRLGSLEPRIITREFAEALAAIPKFCPYFHLSLQSGSDSVLKRMNRHYTTVEFMEKVNILRDVFDRPSINTDVIVGFPGETDEEFEESVEFLRKVNFAKMHIFKYSRRRGTVADKMPGQLTDRQKHVRSEVLQAIDDANHKAYFEGFAGETDEVLFERKIAIGKEQYLVGLTARYTDVAVRAEDAGEELINKICKVKLLYTMPEGYLAAELC